MSAEVYGWVVVEDALLVCISAPTCARAPASRFVVLDVIALAVLRILEVRTVDADSGAALVDLMLIDTDVANVGIRRFEPLEHVEIGLERGVLKRVRSDLANGRSPGACVGTAISRYL